MTKSYFLVTKYGFGDHFLLLVTNFSSACFEHHLRNVFLWFQVIFTRFHGYAGVAASWSALVRQAKQRRRRSKLDSRKSCDENHEFPETLIFFGDQSRFLVTKIWFWSPKKQIWSPFWSAISYFGHQFGICSAKSIFAQHFGHQAVSSDLGFAQQT